LIKQRENNFFEKIHSIITAQAGADPLISGAAARICCGARYQKEAALQVVG
jgi:hypothetical protein